MNDAGHLRARLLSALGLCALVTSFAPAGCAGSSSAEEQRQQLEPSCDRGTVQCFPPGQTHFNPGNVPNPAPPPEPTFDENGCQIVSEVRDGCCNAAQTAGFVDGQCCYGFCTGACCGRPMIVDGAPRLAGVERRSDWAAPHGDGAPELSSELRELVAASWLEDARLEHASIASFARFVLDLLALGAPAELVEAAQRALADEIRHAQGCFALASFYAGAPFGPGTLNLTGVSASASLADAAAAAVREGCIGETIAAFTARAQAAQAVAPRARDLLERIADDEASHAELAWRFVRWALAQGDEAVRRSVRKAFAESHSELQAPQPEEPNEALLNAHGRLSGRQQRELAHQALCEIVAPCAHALLG